MGEEKEYGLLIAAIVSIVAIVGLVILFSRSGTPVGKFTAVADGPATYFVANTPYANDRSSQPAYRQCVQNSDCESGESCYKSSTTGGYVCRVSGWDESQYAQQDLASGRGFWS